jgi:hypothetical protein
MIPHHNKVSQPLQRSELFLRILAMNMPEVPLSTDSRTVPGRCGCGADCAFPTRSGTGSGTDANSDADALDSALMQLLFLSKGRGSCLGIILWADQCSLSNREYLFSCSIASGSPPTTYEIIRNNYDMLRSIYREDLIVISYHTVSRHFYDGHHQDKY